MDRLEIILTKEFTKAEIILEGKKLAPEELDCVNFYVNGRSFIEMVVGELRKESNDVSEAGYGYVGLDPKHILVPYSNILIQPDKSESYLKEENGKILIARCEGCGEALCGGFAIRITVAENRVIWDQIGYWHDTRVEGVIGPFEFDRKEYEQMLRIEYAEYWTGRAYDEGTFVEKDPKKALGHFKISAEKGCIPAHYYLGWYYEEGFAGRKNYKKAKDFYEIAALAGDAWSMLNLGRMYALGKGAKRDYTIAVEWYRKAAEINDALAMTNLAWCYEHGRGVEKDIEEAYSLYLAASDLGEEHAIEWINEQHLISRDEEAKEPERIKGYRLWKDSKGNFSALKFEIADGDMKMIHYNSAYPEGREVEGVGFYKIVIGENTDYDCVSEKEFYEYLKPKMTCR